jgi:uncharacterized protein (TIGR03000 family)
LNRRTGQRALLSVNVPEDAAVYVNGRSTKTPGTHRRYVSYGLQPGYNYTYEIKAVVNRGGRELTDTQVVHVRAGQTRDLAFAFDEAASSAAVATSLTVHVPEDAVVTLEGQGTKATGQTRRFSTTALVKGQRWPDYRVVVSLNRDGRELRREKTIRLVGGEAHEVRFDFDAEQLALR